MLELVTEDQKEGFKLQSEFDDLALQLCETLDKIKKLKSGGNPDIAGVISIKGENDGDEDLVEIIKDLENENDSNHNKYDKNDKDETPPQSITPRGAE